MAKLTAKQQKFVDEYLIDLNATQAAIRAGYSKKTAYSVGAENLKKPEIQNAIDERMSAIQAAKVADAQEVIEYLTAVMRGEESEEAVIVEGQGDGVSRARTIEKDVGAKDRLKAAELLGKRYSLFIDKVNIDGNVKVIFGGEDELED